MTASKTAPKKQLLKKGDIVYFFENGQYVRCTCVQDQHSLQTKKLFIVKSPENQPAADISKNPLVYVDNSRIWAYISGLLTEAEYKGDRQPQMIKKGDLLSWTENGSEPVLVSCAKDQISKTSKKLLVCSAPGEENHSIVGECWANLCDLSPAAEAGPPIEEAAPAAEEVAPATEEVAPAAEEAAPAAEEAAPAAEEAAPATKEVAPAAEEAAPAAEEVAPAAEEAAPAAEEAATVAPIHLKDVAERIVKAQMLKGGQQVFWRSESGEYRKAEIYRDQRSPSSKKIQVIDWKRGEAFASDPHWVSIDQVFTPEQIKKKSEAEQKPESAIETFTQGQWLYWEAKPGDVRFVKCSLTPIDPTHLVWVEEFKGFKDKFTARPEALTSIDSPDVIAECEKLEADYWAKYYAALEKEGAIKKAEAEAAEAAQFTEPNITEESLSFTSPEDFADKMQRLDTPEKIQALCDRLLALPRFANVSEKTKIQRLAEYNKAIKAMSEAMGGLLYEGDRTFTYRNRDGSTRTRHLYFKCVGIADYDWDAANKKAGTKLVKKLDNQAVEIDARRYSEAVKQCSISDNPYLVLAALIADSGRRPIEIIEVGEFVAVQDEAQMLVFSGQAKKRDQPSDPYSIILLEMTAETFLKKLEFVRSHKTIKEAYKGLERKDPGFLKVLSDRIRVQVNRIGVTPNFGWLPPRADEASTSCKTLRSVWAAIVADKHCPDTTNKLLYMSRLLGHFEGDPAALQTTLGYSDITIKKQDKSALSAFGCAPEDKIPAPATTKIKVLSLVQPWAELMVEGLKLIETRNWATKHRGIMAIHAADKIDRDGPLDLLDIPESEYTRGAVIAIAELVDCVKMDQDFIDAQTDLERRCGLWEVGRFAWIFKNFQVIQPIRARGMQKLWNWEAPAELDLGANVQIKRVENEENANTETVDNLVNTDNIDASNSAVIDVVSDDSILTSGDTDTATINADVVANNAVSDNLASVNPAISSPANNSAAEPTASEIVETAEAIETLAIADSEAIAPSYVDFVAESDGRHDLDFYETPIWKPLLMLDILPISGTVGEPCGGYGAISNTLKLAGLTVWTNDLDETKPADYHSDAAIAESWVNFPESDWIITNPPFYASSAILQLAYDKAKRGVALILPIGWFEVCKDRVDFLRDNPPTEMINVPRYCYRKSTKGQWASDKGPAIVYVWDKQSTHKGLTAILPFTAKEIPLFHRTPENSPSADLVKAEVDKIMQKKRQSSALAVIPAETVENTQTEAEGTQTEAEGTQTEVKPAKKDKPASKGRLRGKKEREDKQARELGEKISSLDKITAKMEPFLSYNEKLPKTEKWYVSQTVVAIVAACNNNTANAWINIHSQKLAEHNQGLNKSAQNRGRTFEW